MNKNNWIPIAIVYALVMIPAISIFLDYPNVLLIKKLAFIFLLALIAGASCFLGIAEYETLKKNNRKTKE